MSMDTLDDLLLRQQNLLSNMLGEFDKNEDCKSEIMEDTYVPFMLDEQENFSDEIFEITESSKEPNSITLIKNNSLEETPPHKHLSDISINNTYSLIPQPEIKYNSFFRRIGNFLFWTAFVLAFFSLLAVGVSGNGNRNILGYAFFEVLTDSMQSDIPQGSLILTKQIEYENIRAGDDITFWVDKKTTVTHRVISIIENYENSGQRGFQTQGIENPSPDPDIVYAANIVGKVAWYLPFLGQSLAWLRINWWMCLLVIGGLILAAVAIKILFKKEDEQDFSSERKVEFA